jgi:hypothetical protein
MNDWNPPRGRLADEELPPGIPEWAMGPLLTAAAIIVYLLIRNAQR